MRGRFWEGREEERRSQEAEETMQRHGFSLWGCVTIAYLLNAVVFLGLSWLAFPDRHVTDSNRVFVPFFEVAEQVLMLPFGALLLGCFGCSSELTALTVFVVIAAFVINAVVMGGLFATLVRLIRFGVVRARNRRTP